MTSVSIGLETEDAVRRGGLVCVDLGGGGAEVPFPRPLPRREPIPLDFPRDFPFPLPLPLPLL